MNYMQKAKEILSGSLFIPIEKISDDADINDIKEIDSLAFETIVIEIETVLNKEVDAMDLLELRSVKDLARILEKNQ